MSLNVFVLILFSVISLTLSSDHHVRKTRMIGGKEAGFAQFPYQVALEVGGQFYCGGSVIHPQFVLTAAHCFLDRNGNFKSYYVTVIAGITDLYSKPGSKVVVRAELLYVPKAFTWMNWYIGGDIAVLKLSKSLNVYNNPYIKKVEPPEAKSYWGETAVITGFGYSWVRVERDPRTGRWERGPGWSNGKLRYSKAYITNNAECAAGYGRNGKDLPLSVVCAKVIHPSNSPSGICGGDSGGPLVVNGNVVIGVVSVSPLECHENVQSAIYTRVSYWRDFIEDAIADRRKDNMYIKQLAIR